MQTVFYHASYWHFSLAIDEKQTKQLMIIIIAYINGKMTQEYVALKGTKRNEKAENEQA